MNSAPFPCLIKILAKVFFFNYYFFHAQDKEVEGRLYAIQSAQQDGTGKEDGPQTDLQPTTR